MATNEKESSSALRRSTRQRRTRYSTACGESPCADPPAKRPSPDKKPSASFEDDVSSSLTISDLPEELLLLVCSYCNEEDLCRLAQVSRQFYKISADESIWKKLFMSVFGLTEGFDHDSPSGNDATWSHHHQHQHQHHHQHHYQHQDQSGTPPPDEVEASGDVVASSVAVAEQSSSAFSVFDDVRIDYKAEFKKMHTSVHVYPEMVAILKESPAFDCPRKYFCHVSDAVAACPLGPTSDSDVAAKPALVIVHTGVYYEHIIVDRPVAIVGSGSVTLSSSSGRIFEFRSSAKNSVLSRLTIKGGLPLNSVDSTPYYCIDVPAGCNPIIQDCFISSECYGGACIYVHGPNANPTVRRCEIADSESVGIFVDSEAHGLYSNNDISNNKLAGVWIKNLAMPIFRNNSLHHGRDVGFFIFDRGQGLLEGNTVSENRIAGIEVKNAANPIVLKNNICNGRTGGVYIHDGGRGQFLDNHIYGNQYAGVWITSDSNPTLKGNKIFNGKQGGVYIFSNGRGLLESNDIYGNTLAGVQIRSGSDPLVRRNRIHNGCHGGIYVHDGGLGIIEENEIHSNTLAGVWVTTGSSPVLRRNRIHSGRQVGVYFYDKGGGVLEDNEIYNHRYSGVQIRSQSNPLLRNNKIWGGSNGGILIYNEGLGVIEDNEVFENALAGVWIKKESNPTLRRNKIHHGYECGICVFESGLGVIEDNDIFCNATTGVLINSGSKPTVKGNRVYSCGTSGIEVTNEASGLIEGNSVFDNQYEGISLASGVEPYLKHNRVFGNHNVLNKTLAAGMCLFGVTGDRSFSMHDFYRCKSCQTGESNAVCYSCISHCHEGHEFEFVRRDRFYCDCGAGILASPCQLIGQSSGVHEAIREDASPATEEEEDEYSGGGGIGEDVEEGDHE